VRPTDNKDATNSTKYLPKFVEFVAFLRTILALGQYISCGDAAGA
jgi:hypothetical protein